MTKYIVIGVLVFMFVDIFALISVVKGGPGFFRGVFILVISIVFAAAGLLYFVNKKFRM